MTAAGNPPAKAYLEVTGKGKLLYCLLFTVY